MSVSNPPDDLDALRTVIEAVKDFDQEDQKRIFRWAGEKLGLPPLFASAAVAPPQSPPDTPPVQLPAQGLPASSPPPPAQDIKSFVDAKSPPNDVQFAATVAYYFKFEAPQAERKDAINGDDLQEACRKAKRDRLLNPGKTLSNAHQLGLLDKSGERGFFSVNTVGENLVAMTLPGGSNSAPRVKRARKKATRKKATKKKVPRKS